jgi:hypothetical protein
MTVLRHVTSQGVFLVLSKILSEIFSRLSLYRSILWTLLLDHCVLLLAFSLTLQPSDAVQPFITLLSRLPVLLQAIDLSRSQSQYRTSGKPPVSKGLPLLLETLQTSHALCCAAYISNIGMSSPHCNYGMSTVGSKMSTVSSYLLAF